MIPLKFDPLSAKPKGEDEGLNSIEVMKYLRQLFEDILDVAEDHHEGNPELLMDRYSEEQLEMVVWLFHIGHDICKQLEDAATRLTIRKKLKVPPQMTMHHVKSVNELKRLIEMMEGTGKKDDSDPPPTVH